MNLNDWNNFLKSPTSQSISGQYLIIQWNEEEITFSNDYFGLNTIYFYKNEGIIFYSTRLDLLCKFIPSPKINFASFSGRWILYNQLTDEAIVQDLIKLPPNSEIKIYNNKIFTKTNTQSNKPDNNAQIIELLDMYCNISIPEDYTITLGLSGGLDSRLLLDRFLSLGVNFNLHSFGNNFDNDVIIAKAIANKIKLELHTIEGTFDENNILNKLEEYLVLNELVEPISTHLLTSGINQSYFSNKILIDGAGGELFRRQFLNRLLIRGRKELEDGNPKEIFRYLNLFRADIFNVEINQSIYNYAINQISSLKDRFSLLETTSMENYVDLFVAKTRFPNYYGPDQNHLNSIIPNYMPFVNEEMFSLLLTMPLMERNNNKLFYKFLRNSKNGLSDFNLVKDGIRYPFGIGSKLIFVLVNLKKKLYGIQRNNLTEKFFNINKPLVLSVLDIAEIRQNEMYDQQKIKFILGKYYSGDRKYLNQLDWLFSFELFRRKLKLNN